MENRLEYGKLTVTLKCEWQKGKKKNLTINGEQNRIWIVDRYKFESVQKDRKKLLTKNGEKIRIQNLQIYRLVQASISNGTATQAIDR